MSLVVPTGILSVVQPDISLVVSPTTPPRVKTGISPGVPTGTLP